MSSWRNSQQPILPQSRYPQSSGTRSLPVKWFHDSRCLQRRCRNQHVGFVPNSSSIKLSLLKLAAVYLVDNIIDPIMLYIICQLCTISFLLYGWKWVISVLYKRIQHTTQCTGQRTCWDSCPRYSILICSNGCLSAWLAAKLIWFDGCQSYSTMNPFLSLVHTCSHFYI